MTLCVGSFFLIIRDKPEFPPSAVAEKKIQREQNQWKVICEACKERSYVLLVVIFGVLYGAYCSLSIELSPIFSYYVLPDGSPAYSSTVIAVYGIMVSLAGVGMSVVVAILLQKYQKFLLSLRLICLATIVCACTALVAVPSENIYFTGAVVLFLGIGLIPINPVAINFASELTFPLDPATTNGVLLMIGHGSATIMALIGTPLCQINPECLLIFYVSLTIFAFICSLFIEEKLKKLEY